MTKCPQCGAPNVVGAETCQECGRPLPSTPSAQPLSDTSGTAIASLVCGILGWTLVPVLGSILAIVLGHAARSQVLESRGSVSGEGLAVAGLVLGYSSIALAIGAVALAVVATVLGFVLPIGVLGCALCAC